MKKQIVICDDDTRELKEIKRVVEAFVRKNKMQYSVCEFTSGEKLVHACENGVVHPQIVFMDIELDGENGIDVVKIINRIMPATYVVYVSNHFQYATDVYTTEHQYYVLKSELEERIQDVFNKIRLNHKFCGMMGF